MVRDIKFLYDDSFLEKEKLQEVIREVQKKPKKLNPRAIFLRRFILCMYGAAKKKTQPFKLKEPVRKEIKVKPKVKEKKVAEPKKPVKIMPAPIPEYPEYPVIRTTDNVVLVRAELKDHLYTVKEVALNENEKALFQKMKDKLAKKLTSKPELMNDSEFIGKYFKKYSKKLKLQPTQELYKKIHYFLVKNIIDYGKLNVLFKDHNVKEINLKSLKEPVMISYNNFKGVKTNIKFENNEELRETIKKFFDKAKVKLTKDNTYLDTDKIGFQIKATYDFVGENSKFEIKKLK